MISEDRQRLIEKFADATARDFDDQMDRLLAEWDAIQTAQFAELEDQVRNAANSDNIEALAELVVSTEEAAAVLESRMVAMAELGSNQIVREAAEQGVELQPAIVTNVIRLSELAARANATVKQLASGLADTVQREAMRLWGLADLPGRVREFMNELGDRALRDELGGALHAAQNTGRHAVLLTAPDAAWYATEHRDRSACAPCKAIDGAQFDSLETAQAAYPNGGYVACEGGVRCRGEYVAIWE